MKQLLFLLLFPCLALAQYQGNANQKITLGEQTTADGLVWRGRLADTANLLTNKLDTSVYIVLDTGTRAMWYYRASTTPKWTRLVDSLNNLQGQLSLTTKVTGTLPVANGGTNRTTMPAGYILHGDGTSVDTAIGLFWDRTNSRLGVATNSPVGKLDINGDIKFKNSLLGEITSSGAQIVFFNNNNEAFWINMFNNNNTGRFICGIEGAAGATFTGSSANSAFFGSNRGDLHILSDGSIRQTIKSTGNIGIGTVSPSEKLHVFGNARITAMNNINDIGANADGVLQAATSDMNLKNTIENSPFGLNEILLLNSVTFLYNDENRKMDSDVKEVGFIAQDVFDVIPNAVSSTGTGDLQLDYRAITATLVKAIQEQQALIKALEQRILNLENK